MKSCANSWIPCRMGTLHTGTQVLPSIQRRRVGRRLGAWTARVSKCGRRHDRYIIYHLQPTLPTLAMVIQCRPRSPGCERRRNRNTNQKCLCAPSLATKGKTTGERHQNAVSQQVLRRATIPRYTSFSNQGPTSTRFTTPSGARSPSVSHLGCRLDHLGSFLKRMYRKGITQWRR